MEARLLEIVRQRYTTPHYSVEPLDTTRHFNVVRIVDNVLGSSMVAKGIFHIEGNANLGPLQSNAAFETEANILSILPDWWGIHLLDSFRSDDVRVVVTPELPTRPWRLYEPSIVGDRRIADALERQLRFLHSQQIAHRDLELKNVLLTEEGPVIIDFEKACLSAGIMEMCRDWEKLVGSLREQENTRRIGDFLATRAPLGRRHSVGGTRRRRRRSRKYKP